MAACVAAFLHINAGLKDETRPYIFKSAESKGGGEQGAVEVS